MAQKAEATDVIGRDFVVTGLGVVGGQVRLGVRAPLAVSVHREEVRMRIGAPTAT